MPALASFTLDDGASTPVSHTFTPVKVDSAQVAKFVDKSVEVQLGQPTITIQVKEASKASPTNKVTMRVAIPKLEIIAGGTIGGIEPPPTLAYTDLAVVELSINRRSNLQDRKNLKAYLANLLDEAIAASAIHDLEGSW